jgi:hypothetical protein
MSGFGDVPGKCTICDDYNIEHTLDRTAGECNWWKYYSDGDPILTLHVSITYVSNDTVIWVDIDWSDRNDLGCKEGNFITYRYEYTNQQINCLNFSFSESTTYDDLLIGCTAGTVQVASP